MSTLIFVYNADSGLFNTLTDMARKILAPHTYTCRLCRITYGNFRVRREWQAYIDSLDMPMEFLHRDEYIARYGKTDTPLPVILRRDGDTLDTLADAGDINACESIDDLKKLLTARLTRD